MHLPNGAVTPACALYGAGVAILAMTPVSILARRSAPKHPWRLALASAGVLAAQSFNLTVLPGASSGHAIGGFLLACFFGAGWGAIAITAVLMLQAILFQDGGLMTLPLNVVNMAIIPCLVVYPLWKWAFGRATGIGRYATIFVAAWLSVVLAAAACSVELLSIPVARSQAGAVVATMLVVHALIGLVEGGATALVAIAAARLARAPRWLPILGGGATAIGLAVAGALGSSPWPDGLEYTTQKLGIEEAAAGISAWFASLQTRITPWQDYSVCSSLLGCAAVAVLMWACANCLRTKARI